MCFYNSMNQKIRNLAKRYGKKSDIVEIYQDILEENYRIGAFGDSYYPCITSDEEIQVFEWGLIPHWLFPRKNTEEEKLRIVEEAEKIRKMTYNARSETIFELPSFRSIIRSQRCLIPSTGYYEWRHEGKDKIPYYIFVKDSPIFSMAGIYDSWANPVTGEILHTFSMITTPANELTGYIHNGGKNPNRMPAILAPEEEKRWLDPKLEKEEIKTLLQTYPAEKMDAYPISRDFFRKLPTDPSIIEKVAKPLTLF